MRLYGYFRSAQDWTVINAYVQELMSLSLVLSDLPNRTIRQYFRS